MNAIILVVHVLLRIVLSILLLHLSLRLQACNSLNSILPRCIHVLIKYFLFFKCFDDDHYRPCKREDKPNNNEGCHHLEESNCQLSFANCMALRYTCSQCCPQTWQKQVNNQNEYRHPLVNLWDVGYYIPHIAVVILIWCKPPANPFLIIFLVFGLCRWYIVHLYFFWFWWQWCFETFSNINLFIDLIKVAIPLWLLLSVRMVLRLLNVAVTRAHSLIKSKLSLVFV